MPKTDLYKKRIKKYKNKAIEQSIVKDIFGKSKELMGSAKEIQNYILKLPETERKIITRHIVDTRERYKTIERLFIRKEKRKAVDSIFFSFDELPLFGKEYWFMKFTSDTGSKTQLLFMFGRSAGDVEINGKYLENKKLSSDKHHGYVVSWAYDDKQKSIVDDHSTIKISKTSIDVKNKSVFASFSGCFPKYNLNISKNDKEICSLKIIEPENETLKFEICENYKAFFGYDLVNLYFDFKGKLFGKDFSGKCYVQKVVVVGPFIPWRWGRIVFKNNSILTYFIPNLEVLGLEYRIDPYFSYYDSVSKKNYNYTDVDAYAFPCANECTKWIVTGNKNNLFICMTSYSHETFRFKKWSNFTYIEYLVEVIDFSLTFDGKNISLKDVGGGIGMVEDTGGYVF